MSFREKLRKISNNQGFSIIWQSLITFPCICWHIRHAILRKVTSFTTVNIWMICFKLYIDPDLNHLISRMMNINEFLQCRGLYFTYLLYTKGQFHFIDWYSFKVICWQYEIWIYRKLHNFQDVYENYTSLWCWTRNETRDFSRVFYECLTPQIKVRLIVTKLFSVSETGLRNYCWWIKRQRGKTAFPVSVDKVGYYRSVIFIVFTHVKSILYAQKRFVE